jgi:hypothetical protein
MSEGANRFFNSIEDASRLSEAELTDFFVYYLTIEAEVGAANATRVCRHLSQTSAQTRCNPARKFRAVFS